MLVCRGIVSSRLYRRCTARSIASANPVSRVLPRGYTRSQGVLKRANPLPEQGFEKYGHSQVRPFGAHTTTYLCKGRRYAEALQTFYAKSDIFGATTLISSTTATGNDGIGIDEAFKVYTTICEWQKPDNKLFGVMITACRRCNCADRAFTLWDDMKKYQVAPDKLSIGMLLAACVDANNISLAKQIFSDFRSESHIFNTITYNQLIKVFCKINNNTSHLSDAMETVQYMIAAGVPMDSYTFSPILITAGYQRDISTIQAVYETVSKMSFFKQDMILVTNLIIAFSKCGDLSRVCELWDIKKLSNPDVQVYLAVIQACTCPAHLEFGVRLHKEIAKSDFKYNVKLNNWLITMYSRCGSFDRGKVLFTRIQERGQLDAATFTNYIVALTNHGDHKTAIQLFLDTKNRGGFIFDELALCEVLKACSNAQDYIVGQQIHNMILQGEIGVTKHLVVSLHMMLLSCAGLKDAQMYFWDTLSTMPQLVDAYVCTNIMKNFTECGLSGEAVALYDIMLERGIILDSCAYITLVEACSNCADANVAKKVYNDIRKSGEKVGSTLATCIIRMFSKCECISDAYSVFTTARTHNELSVHTWASMISAYGKAGLGKEAISLYEQMQQENVEPDAAIFAIMLQIYSSSKCGYPQFSRAKDLYIEVSNNKNIKHPSVLAAAINMFAKSGDLEKAVQIFDHREQEEEYPAVWNALISAYGTHGKGSEALEAFAIMREKGITVTPATLVFVLHACSHVNLVEEALYWYNNMMSFFGFGPTMHHKTCIVDALGRAGKLKEAEELLAEIASPDVVVYLSLLGACKNLKNLEYGDRIGKQAINLFPYEPALYVLLANIYGYTGQIERQQAVWNLMASRGMHKIPCKAWIVDPITDATVAFVVDDQTHKEMKQIHKVLATMRDEVKKLGYIPDTTYVSQQNLSQEQKEIELWKHSEKLALGYLITKGIPKNGKYLSLVIKAEIVVSDANRFHHFKDGVCSCNDYY